MKQLILVEGTNDRHFLQALLQEMKLAIVTDVLAENNRNEMLWEELGGSNLKLLIDKLAYIRKNIHGNNYIDLKTIGIVLDADDLGIETQMTFVNEAISKVFQTQVSISKENEVINISFVEQKIAVNLTFIFHCIKVAGKGELFTLLRNIKKKESHYSDCLAENWQKCYEKKEIAETHKIGENEFDKFWVQVYLKFDTVQKSKRDKNSSNLWNVFKGEDGRGREVFNFESPHLNGLKDFLGLFR